MTFDFRASQLRTSKIIASGSTGTNAQLLLYPIAADGTPANQGNIDPVIFGTGSIGQDVWFFASGALGSLDGSSGGVAAFGGDVHISGNLRVGTVLFSTLSSSLYGLSSSYTALSAAFVALSSSVASGSGSSTFSSSWIETANELRTTGSVAISPDGAFASAHGTDTYFYVSGSGANKAVFGGTVHFSGTVEADGNFGPIQVGTVTTTNATPAVVWSTTLSDYALQNINLTLIGKQTNNANYAKFNREFTLYKTTGSVAFTDFINAYVPDYQSNGAWGFSLELSGSDLKLYATGSAGVNVFWKSQAIINSITTN